MLLVHRPDAPVHLLTLHEILRVRGVRRRDDRRLVGLHRAGEDAIERIVVGCWNRIELVIVAARAGDGQPEERLRRDVDAIVDDVVTLPLKWSPSVRKPSAASVAGFFLAFCPSQQVGGELFTDEPVVRQIVVERLDDVVAVGPRIGKNGVSSRRRLSCPLVSEYRATSSQ